MTDIIDRLRADTLRSGTWADTGNLMLEAAEEIERLRSENEDLRIQYNLEKNAAEVQKRERQHMESLYERLRAAIRNRSQP